MKILTAKQIKALDQHTIKEQNITSTELMERAAFSFVTWYVREYDQKQPVNILAGIGDNGGDGLAVGRLLAGWQYEVKIFIIRFSQKMTKDFEINLKRLSEYKIKVIEIEKNGDFPVLDKNAVVIDAILGAGLNRPLKGWLADLVTTINQNTNQIIAIDIPSGTFADEATETVSIEAQQTFSFELPKLAFLFPENYKRVGAWQINTIDSSKGKIETTPTPYHYIDQNLIKTLYRPKGKYNHKGTNGHALLVVGSYGMMGAAVLAGKAALRSGAGLVTLHVPKSGYQIIQTVLPEAIVSLDKSDMVFSTMENFNRYTAVGIGCGLGKAAETATGLLSVLEVFNKPLVLDADALNIIAANNWQSKIPKGSILTPHLKEFQRLFGKSNNDFERNHLQRKWAKKLGITIILKGAHTAIAASDGNCYFNSTGNPGMATGGSGDVLTGIITALVAQGYQAKSAAILGVYLHGLAGDTAAKRLGFESLIASDLIEGLGKGFLEIQQL